MSSPSIAVVFLQPHCNMRCTFCVTEEGFDAMRFAQAVELLDALVARGIGSVVLGGGEPFAWPGDVVALAREAKTRGLFVQVGTNGIGLPDDFTTIECIDRFVLPLESTDARVHDGMRQHPRSHHARIVERLAALRSAGRSVTVSTVVTAANASGVLELAAWLRRYAEQGGDLHAWHLYQFLPLGRGGRAHADDLAIPAAEYFAICDAVSAEGLPFAVFRRTDMYRSTSVEFFWAENGRVTSGAEVLHRAPAPALPPR